MMFELVRELVKSAADLGADLEVAAEWEDWQYTENESNTIQKSGSGVGKPVVSPHPPLKKERKKVTTKGGKKIRKTRLSYYNVTTRLVDLVGFCWFYKNLTEKIC